MICEYSNAVQPHPLLSDHLFCGLKPCKKIPRNKNGACPLWTDSINVKLDLVVGVLVGSPTRLLAQSLFLCNLLRSVSKLCKLGRLNLPKISHASKRSLTHFETAKNRNKIADVDIFRLVNT